MGRKGFSLIELLIILVVISILASIGYASLQRYRQAKEMSQAQQTLVSTLNGARSDARRASKNQTVSWTEKTIRVEEEGAGDARTVQLTDSGAVRIVSVSGVSGSTFSYQAPNARINQDSFMFTLEGRGGLSAQVSVTGVTGKAFSR